ncbi:MAG: AGE family epimerase/isomerase [Bacteroidia bacterium]
MDDDLLLKAYKEELDQEFEGLMNWWRTYSIDEAQGGFFGEVGNNNVGIGQSSKGLVLNARILWTFSSAFLFKGSGEDLAVATRAFDYIFLHFYDAENGGFYWSVSANGEMLDGKKQIYGQAFAIYGLSAYHEATGDLRALQLAKETFELIEKYSYDDVNLGYKEACSRAWRGLSDLRLSEKDLNTEKSMNTHLHIIEAYASLYQVWENDQLAMAIRNLLFVFKRHMLTDSSHLSLFFSARWVPQSSIISYGHDIEAAWLLQECAEILGDKEEVSLFKMVAINLTHGVKESIDQDGGMFYEFDPKNDHMVREKHWWPQAEAMVGFFNAYQLTKDSKYLLKSIASFDFVKAKLKDREFGEWYWGIDPDGTLMKESKAGFWKCPYHNGRACIEILKRMGKP